MVSKAFQVLSGTSHKKLFIFPILCFLTVDTDPQKRAVYDSGTDPEDRFGGMSSRGSGFSDGGVARFDGEISPEDLFNMFFGGGGNAFGPGGFQTFGGGGPSEF